MSSDSGEDAFSLVKSHPGGQWEHWMISSGHRRLALTAEPVI